MRLIERPGRVLPGSHIYFEGKDLAAIPERELERRFAAIDMSMVFQEPMTSLNPVSYGRATRSSKPSGCIVA